MAPQTQHRTQETLELDLLVIGFGKAGKTIAMKRAKAGDRVAIVEKLPSMYGGTCINIACVPTKRLLESAAAGLEYLEAKEDRNGFIAKLNAANKAMAEGAGALVIDGHARFVGPHTVQVTGEGELLEITAQTVVINTGAASSVEVDERLHDSTSIQQLAAKPASLGIVGAGPIGIEFATMFNEFGVPVTLYNGSREFLGFLDPEIAQAVREHLESQGITIKDEKVADPKALPEEKVLMAVGRKPVVEDLGLDAAGVRYSADGIEVDERCRTSVDGVYAVGDVTGAPQFTYLSYDDHRVVMADRWGSESEPRTRTGRIYPRTTFSNPPLSTIGLSEREAREQGFEVEVRQAKVADLAIVPRPKILKQPEGVVKFVLDAGTNQILGAVLFCVDSQELINTVAVAMRAGITASELGDGIFTHPSTSEIFNALLA